MKKMLRNIGHTSKSKPDEAEGGESALSKGPRRSVPSSIIPLEGGGGGASSSTRPAHSAVLHTPPSLKSDRGRSCQRVDHVSRAVDLHFVDIVVLCAAGQQ